MATAVERALCTMLDPPDSTMDVMIMPDFLLKFADWMDWHTLTMLRGINYGCSVILPTWQPWHSIGALLYGYQLQVISCGTYPTQSSKTLACSAPYARSHCTTSTSDNVTQVGRFGCAHHQRALCQALHIR